MAPRIRLYEKKRGKRRTGSRFWGSVFEGAFYLALLLGGCVLLVWILVTRIYPQWGVNRYYVEALATVLDKRIVTQGSPRELTYRPEVCALYRVGAAEYRIWTYDAARHAMTDRDVAELALERFQRGARYPIYYNPAEPSVAVLVRDVSGANWLLLVVPSALVVLGSAGLLYRVAVLSQSTERRAAMSARRKAVDFFDEAPASDTAYPTIPADNDLTNSPGTRLAYRLPIDTAAGWKLAGTAVACVVWNVGAALLASVALRDHLDGEPNWLLSALTAPFIALGVWLVVYLIRLWVNTTGVGPTRLEISAHPLRPGGQCEAYLCLSQSGQLRFDSFTLSLVCEERAIYRLGTDARTMTQRVYARTILGGDETMVRHDHPYEAVGPFHVPVDAMHSFRAAHNAVEWKLVLKGRIHGWPDYVRSFPLVVYPACTGGACT